MTLDEKHIIEQLHLKVTFLPGHYDKIFVRNIHNSSKTNPYYELTQKQRDYMYNILHKYRQQVPTLYKKYHPNKRI